MHRIRLLAVVSATVLAATALPVTASVAVANSPAHSETVHARGDVVVAANRPVVTRITPEYGTFGGGTRVVIRGKHLATATAVKFGSKQAKSFRIVNSKKIIAKAPAGSGKVAVRVKTTRGKSKKRAATVFKYSAFVTSISPSSFPAGGGALVTIKGSGFTGVGTKSASARSVRAGVVSAVLFGSTPATQLTLVDSSTVTAISPPLPPGDGSVHVVIDGVASPATPSSGFVALPNPPLPAPVVTGLNPTSGPQAGGTSVTIAGTGFTGATEVKFGTTTASFTIDSDTQITATSPAGDPGTVNVSVASAGGASPASTSNEFTYLAAAAPTITSILPNQGSTDGGTSVTIRGFGFSGATSVKFGSRPSPGYTIVSDSEITATSSNACSTGTVDIVITTPLGTSAITAADQFTYTSGAIPMSLVNDVPVHTLC